MFGDNFTDTTTGMGGMGGIFGGSPGTTNFTFGTANGGNLQTPSRQDPPIEHPLNLNLEELYTGCTKKMKISRTVTTATGQHSKEEKIVSVDVKPGWKAGTKVTFAREGDQVSGKIPSDIVFVIGVKPHAKFERDGNDLRHKARLPLKTALCGGEVVIPHIEGGSSKHQLKEVVSPTSQLRLSGRGMPISKQPGRRGDLLVNYDIVFPKTLSDTDKKQLQNILAKYQ